MATEEKHLELARHKLNRHDHLQPLTPKILATAEGTMRLFAATMICHDADKGSFSIDPYRCEPR